MRTVIAPIALLLIWAPARAQNFVDYASAPPATDTALLKTVVIVVHGRVETRRLETAAGPPTSIYGVRILELFKNDGRHAVGQVIGVHRHGGFDPETDERGFPPFDISDEVVLFLERGNNGWYWPLSGPHTSFKLTVEGRVHAYGRTAVAKRHHGRPTGEFLAAWRKYKK